MDYLNFIIFRDWFTLHFHDKSVQSLYQKEKYIFYRMMFSLICFFLTFTVILSLNLWYMYNDKTKSIEIDDLIFNAVMAFLNLIFMLLLAFWKTKYWFFNMLSSFFMNYTHFILFESIKILSWVVNQNKTGPFIITIIEFVTKGLWLFFVDDNFVYNLVCYLGFIPIYIGFFTTQYEKQDNEIGFFIIIFTFLAVGIYFIERIFKIAYFGRATYRLEINRNKNLIDNMKSGFVTFNLDNGKTTYNKIMKKKFVPKLLEGTAVNSESLNLFADTELEEKNQADTDDLAYYLENENNIVLTPDQTIDLEKKCNIIKNILFTRLERVNAHEFDGEIKKATETINAKINSTTTKSNKFNFYKHKTKNITSMTVNTNNNIGQIGGLGVSNDEISKYVDKSENIKNEDFSENRIENKKESNRKSPQGYVLLNDSHFEYIISILISHAHNLKQFVYLGTKSISQEHDEDFTCQVYVRYHFHGRNLEFVLCEGSNKNKISLDTLAKGLITKGYNNMDTKPNLLNKSFNYNSTFLNKANSTIKHPLKEISLKMREALELVENADENINDLKEIMYYCDNLAGMASYALEDMKYTSKVGKKKINMDKQKVDLPSLLENVIDLSKASLKFKNKDIAITYDIDKNVDDSLVTDSKKLTHILLNLINNSINACNKGSIHVFVDSKHRKRDLLTFTVYDQGNQLSKEKMNYYNKTYCEDFDKVTGLVICKQLVEVIGRDLKLEPNGGVGTKVSFIVKNFEDEGVNEDPQLTTDISDEEELLKNEDPKEKEEVSNYNNQYSNQYTKFDKNYDNVSKNNQSISNYQTLVKGGGNMTKNIIKRFSIALNQEIIDTSDLRIIFADNDTSLRSTFRKHIETLAKQNHLKFDIIECKDGADLLYCLYNHYLENKPIDALLFDENMDFISGTVLVEILSILFKRSVLPDITVMMTTDYEITPSQYKFLHHITKPVDYNSIKKNMQHLLTTQNNK